MVVKKKSCKGSITIEACISFPVFLSVFYLLLFLVRVACINIVMDHAVSETARYFAGSLYPLSFLNEYEDEKMERPGSISSLRDIQPISESHTENILPAGLIKTLLIPGELNTNNIDLITGKLTEFCGDDLTGVLSVETLESLYNEYLEIKETGKYYLAELVLDRYLKDSWVNTSHVNLKLVKFPQGQAEYTGHLNTGFYEHIVLQPQRDFTRNDVVIIAEYLIELPFSFLPRKNLTLRYAAIERAWLKGANGVYTSREEGLDLFREGIDKEYVYITRTGNKYHIYSSCAYLEKSSIPITRKDAEKKGLTPHLGCPHRFK